MEFTVDYVLSYFIPSVELKSYFIILFTASTAMLAASILTAYRYLKGNLPLTTLFCTLFITLSYMATDYLITYMFFGNTEELTINEQLGFYPLYSFFDIFTGIALLLITPFLSSEPTKRIPSSTLVAVGVLLVNAVAHLGYLFNAFVSPYDITIASVMYIGTINITDFILILTLFFPVTTNRVVDTLLEKRELAYS